VLNVLKTGFRCACDCSLRLRDVQPQGQQVAQLRVPAGERVAGYMRSVSGSMAAAGAAVPAYHAHSLLLSSGSTTNDSRYPLYLGHPLSCPQRVH